MAFRDSFDQCPRCGITLEDAQSARGCRGCLGMFVDEPVLSEMILRMLPTPPRPFGRLALSELQRSGQPLACPSCGDAMKATTIHEVELDHCPKHGVWFDQSELQITLYRVGLPGMALPFHEWEPPPQPWEIPRPARRPVETPLGPAGVFELGGQQVTTPLGVIKIGRMVSAGIRIDGDPDVARMHAVIELSREQALVIDLGSAAGTLVNGERKTKATLRPGDVLRFGSTDVRFVGIT